MKKVFNGALGCVRTTMSVLAQKGILKVNLLGCLLVSLVIAGCTKEGREGMDNEVAHMKAQKGMNERNPVFQYTGLSSLTVWELQQARAASAKYKNIENAKRDGYIDIGVRVENMGHHFMKEDLVDGTFDVRKPEILVYNKDERGNYYLVAVEYAVPIDLPRPEGFTGSQDVWDNTSGFPLWLLHAWVWEYNPEGVFNATNPSVHIHL